MEVAERAVSSIAVAHGWPDQILAKKNGDFNTVPEEVYWIEEWEDKMP